MGSSAMGLKLGSLGFCEPHMLKQTQNKHVHDLGTPCSVLLIFIFTIRPPVDTGDLYMHLTNHGYFDYGENPKTLNFSHMPV